LHTEVSTIDDEIQVEKELISLGIMPIKDKYQKQTVVVRKQIRLLLKGRINKTRSQSRSA